MTNDQSKINKYKEFYKIKDSISKDGRINQEDLDFYNIDYTQYYRNDNGLLDTILTNYSEKSKLYRVNILTKRILNVPKTISNSIFWYFFDVS